MRNFAAVLQDFSGIAATGRIDPDQGRGNQSPV
jgi:hypothetical protein